MANIFLKLIKLYQKTLSPDHGVVFTGVAMRCRFYPSCSQYTYGAIDKFGVGRGLVLGFLRILKCNPFSKGGINEIR